MIERLRAIVNIDYPADAESLKIIRSVGGRRNLSAKQQAKVKIKSVNPGEWCDDLYESIVEHWIKKGYVERVKVAGEPAKILTKKTKFKAYRGEKVSIAPKGGSDV